MANYKRLFMVLIYLTAVLVSLGVAVVPLFASGVSFTAGGASVRPLRATTNRYGPGSSSESVVGGEPASLPPGFHKAAADGSLELYFRKETAEVALKDKASGQIWFSNPIDRNGETKLQGTAKAALASQLSLTYYGADGQSVQMDSYNDSVALGNMTYQETAGKLAVTYTFGRKVVTVDDVPQQMSKQRFDQFTSKLSSDDAYTLQADYQLATIQGITDQSFVSAMEKKYPKVSQHDIYYLSTANDYQLAQIKELWDKVGYTSKDLKYDNDDNGIRKAKSENINFTVELDYTLRNDNLWVCVDSSKIVHPEGVPISTLDVLQYFGAGGNKAGGYLLVPDGSGSLIHFNNGKSNVSEFEMPVYGADGVDSDVNGQSAAEKCSLPAFGIKSGRSALLVSMDRGESLAVINACVSGMQSSYNCAYFTLKMTQSQKVQISSNFNYVKSETKPYDGVYELRYAPVAGNDPGVAEMASVYQRQLVSLGWLKKKPLEKSYPAVVSLVGGVPVSKVSFGVPIETVTPLTTYGQAADVISALRSGGVSGLSLQYLGWFNHGVQQKVASNIRLERSLGGAAEFRSLVRTAASLRVGFYPQVSFTRVFGTGGGFSLDENIQGVGKNIVMGFYYNNVNRYARSDLPPIYQLTSGRLGELTGRFLRAADANGLSSLASDDIGSVLSSDFNPDAPMNREQSKQNMVAGLSGLAAKKSLALNDPNAYALSDTSLILDMPLQDSMYKICDESVPFYQMVVRGYVDYVTAPLNDGTDYETSFLEAVEYGAGLNYLVSGRNASVLKNTPYEFILSPQFSSWQAVIQRDYTRAAKVLSPLQGVGMVGNSCVGKDLYATLYANGTRVYVNYGNTAATVDGVKVAARDFAVKGGG